MNSETTLSLIKSKEPTQNSYNQDPYGYKSFSTEKFKSVDFFLELTWNRDETTKLQFEGHFKRILGFYVKAYPHGKF